MLSKYALYFTTLVFTVLAFFLQVAPSVESVHIQATLKISAIEAADISGIFLIVYGIMQIPNGMILDRYGIRVLPLFALLALSGALVYWLFNYEITLATSRFLGGLGCSIAFTSAIYIAAHIFSPKKLPFFIALVSVSASTGAIVSTKLLRYVIDEFGWQFTQVIICIIAVAIVIGAFLLARNFYGENRPAHKPLPFNFWKKTKYIFRQKKLISIFGYSFFTWFIMMSFAGYWAKDYLVDVHQYSETQALGVMQAYWVSYLVASLVFSYFARGAKRCMVMIKILAFISIITFLFMVYPIKYSDNIILVVAIFAGASTAGVPLGFSIIAYNVPESLVGFSVAMNNTFLVLGGLFGQLLFGGFVAGFSEVVVESFGGIQENYYLALLLLPLCSVIAFAILIIGLNRKHKSKIAEYKD